MSAENKTEAFPKVSVVKVDVSRVSTERDLEKATSPSIYLPRGRRLSRPRTNSISHTVDATTEEEDVTVDRQIEEEEKNDIKYRTCSWQKAAALLFAEYVGIGAMSFPWAYSVLGLVPALLITVGVACITWYLSYVVWDFCSRHPEVKDVTDAVLVLFNGNRYVWVFTAILYVAENTLVQALHCLVGTKYLNTVTNNGTCTVIFAILVAAIGWLCTLPRTFNGLSKLATFVSFATFCSIILGVAFALAQGHPAGWPTKGPVEYLLFPKAGTKFILAMNGTLTIIYTFTTQMAVPSIMAEMKEPRSFPKALAVATVAEICIFAICGSIIYTRTGNNYVANPTFASLTGTFEVIAYSFMVPTIIYMAVFHCSLSGRFIFFNAFAGTKHIKSNTIIGWASWTGILAGLWIIAFLLYELVPLLSQMMNLIVSLFEPYFGFFIWGFAYFRMRYADHGPTFWKRNFQGFFGAMVNIFLLMVGLFIFTCGTYVSLKSVFEIYKAGSLQHPFSCASNQLNAMHAIS